jgi:DNA-binding transcriptional MerR regulator
MKAYTVRQLARMAGVTPRTLHHYDHIGLLKPTARTPAGYRLYGEADLLRLQHILFFRELEFPLSQIQGILDQPGFDQIEALKEHRRMLEGRAERLRRLVQTIDKTLRKLTEDTMEITDAELYEGFTQEQIDRYRREAREMYDPALVDETERRVKKMSRAEWKAVGAEGEAVTVALAAVADRAPDDVEVQALIGRHHGWIEHFYACPAERYRGLGQLYAEHPEFRAFYEKYRPGLADFMRAAMEYYSDHALAG